MKHNWIIVGALLLIAQTSMQIAPAFGATHTVGPVTIAPNAVAAGQPTPVTITAEISDPALIPTSVNLLIYGTNGSVVNAGSLVSEGDGIFTAAVNLTLSPGESLAVSAAFLGTLRRVISTPISPTFISVPGTFAVNAALAAAGGALSLDNFGGAYLQGGTIPDGGASIDINPVPLPPGLLSDFITSELDGNMPTSTSTQEVSGITCTEVIYTDTIETDPLQHVTVYCPSGSTLAKFYLTYYPGDPHEPQFLANFQQVLNNAQISP